MSAYTVKQFINPNELQKNLAIDQHDITGSLMTQAGYFSHYSAMAAKAQAQLDKFEQLESVVSAKLEKQVRKDMLALGVKVTEAQIKAEVATAKELIAIQNAIIDARAHASMCKGVAESFRHRRDMLIQISLNDREERKGEARVGESRPRESQEERAERFDRIRQQMSENN